MPADWWSVWWVWMAGALVLGILEVILPGYIFLGFAAGAAGVSVLILLGLAFSLPWSLVVFALISLVAYLAFRRLFGLNGGRAKIWDTDIND